MTEGYESFLALPERDRRDVVETAAARLDTLPAHVRCKFQIPAQAFALRIWHGV